MRSKEPAPTGFRYIVRLDRKHTVLSVWNTIADATKAVKEYNTTFGTPRIRAYWEDVKLLAKIKTLPSKDLMRWIENHPGIVWDVDFGTGFVTEDGLAYDVLMFPGWCRGDEYGLHTIIERKAGDVLAILRSRVPCDCESCKDSAQSEGIVL